MAQGKQAKVLTERQIVKALAHIESNSRYPTRDRVMFMLSIKAGLRAKEIASLTWGMVTDAEGKIGDESRESGGVIALENKASKGRNGGRTIPLNRELRAALEAYRGVAPNKAGGYVIVSERDERLSPGSCAMWFYRLFDTLGFSGCSSHSGRRTFITRAARKVSEAGGSLRDVQQLAGHSSLQTTQRYVEGDTDAKRKLVNLI